MWQAVQDEQKTGGQQAKDYYIKTSVITDKRQRNRFLASGVIYRNEKIRDYMNQVKSDIDKGIVRSLFQNFSSRMVKLPSI